MNSNFEVNSLNKGMCMGFIAGVLDWRTLVNARGYCDVPDGVTLKIRRDQEV